MTPQQTQELKALLCEGCRAGEKSYHGETIPNETWHVNSEGFIHTCTVNPAVIEWVEKQLEQLKLEKETDNGCK